MKVVFISNYLTLHQLPFCLEIIKILGNGNFIFISMEGFDVTRSAVGYKDLDKEYDFVLRAYESQGNLIIANKITYDCDVALINPEYFKFSKIRQRCKKITFFVSERLLKRGYLWRFNPLKILKTYRNILRFCDENFYVLCCGAYVSSDYQIMGFPRDRYFKWGYFPNVNVNGIIRKKERSILWVGRVIKWKRLKDLVLALSKINKYIDFRLTIIGDGECLPGIKETIKKYNMSDKVIIRGGLSNEEVLREMQETEIFVTTSDRNEGWGAVINEAMISQCAVIASDAMGAARFLIDNRRNGFVYKCGDIKELISYLTLLLNNVSLLREIQICANRSILTKWSAKIAANNLVELVGHIKNNDSKFPLDGPCSRASFIKY